jgi:hypothetical protein
LFQIKIISTRTRATEKNYLFFFNFILIKINYCPSFPYSPGSPAFPGNPGAPGDPCNPAGPTLPTGPGGEGI